jgi:hypothetical protein
VSVRWDDFLKAGKFFAKEQKQQTRLTMAFDQPIEADRVEDLGFVSSFLRAPIVGTIMWILGGDEAQKREEQEKQKAMEKELIGESSSEVDGELDSLPSLQLQQLIDRNKEAMSGLALQKKKPPSMIGSDISDFGDCALVEEAEIARPDSSDSRDGPIQHATLKRTKKMSWSDESGHRLAVYMDEEVSLLFGSYMYCSEVSLGSLVAFWTIQIWFSVLSLFIITTVFDVS